MSNAEPASSPARDLNSPPGYFRSLGQPFVAEPLSSPGASLSSREGISVSMTMENQIRNLRLAFENGKIPRDLYAKNLLRLLGLGDHPTAQKVADAFVSGRIDQALFARNLGNLRSSPRPGQPDPIDAPPPPP